MWWLYATLDKEMYIVKEKCTVLTDSITSRNYICMHKCLSMPSLCTNDDNDVAPKLDKQTSLLVTGDLITFTQYCLHLHTSQGRINTIFVSKFSHI